MIIFMYKLSILYVVQVSNLTESVRIVKNVPKLRLGWLPNKLGTLDI